MSYFYDYLDLFHRPNSPYQGFVTSFNETKMFSIFLFFSFHRGIPSSEVHESYGGWIKTGSNSRGGRYENKGWTNVERKLECHCGRTRVLFIYSGTPLGARMKRNTETAVGKQRIGETGCKSSSWDRKIELRGFVDIRRWINVRNVVKCIKIAPVDLLKIT